MLILAKRFSELDYSQLMDVYAEHIQKNKLGPARAEQDFYDFLTQTFFQIPGAEYAIWEEQGKYISALRLEPYENGFLVEGLETAPENRGRGLGFLLLNAVIQKLESRGNTILYSHVERKNQPSMALHRKLRFEKILDHAVYVDGSVLSSAVTLRRNVFG